MEYGVMICDQQQKKERANPYVGSQYDDNENRYVLYASTRNWFTDYLFSDKNLQCIQNALYELLKCLRNDGRPIIVSKKTIAMVLSQIQVNFMPSIGDIYTLYNIPQEKARDDNSTLNKQTTEFIYNQLKTEYEIEVNNSKLTIWTTLLGDFNEHGLRSHSQIKLNAYPINKLLFNMNY